MADTYPAMTITLLGLAQLRYSHKLSVFYDLFIWLLTTLGASFRQNIGISFFYISDCADPYKVGEQLASAPTKEVQHNG